ncbi:MAG: cytochrome c [Sulfurovum sp.]|nr:cytochrome c [Sulfurovum sp.]MCB4758048.1 cytochrome c [Sulfurovum sp.]MCB4779202.1 cytochrome c [Sulfurovum sp.]MCB4783236.1 cytochrome c [Sulfurovum sp.]
MHTQSISILFLILFIILSSAFGVEGKKVFETYCWGCHHQTAMAFGPPLSQIATKRTPEEIQAMIANPEAVSKIFGYQRNAMPPFQLKPEELKAITAYIFSFGVAQDINTGKKK